MTIYENLLEYGYYNGSSLEIFTPDEIRKLQDYIIRNIQRSFVNEKKNDWYYFLSCDWPDKDPSKNKTLKYSEIPEQLQKIKDESATVTQSWYYKPYLDLSDKPLEFDVIYKKMNSYIAKIYNLDEKNVSGYPNITYYDKNDFIDVHEDGKNINRICGLLLYLTPEENYKKEYGGKLYLRPADLPIHPIEYTLEHLPIHVDPISPNMVILDFTKHNILHAVEKCYKNFYRTALLTFFVYEQSFVI